MNNKYINLLFSFKGRVPRKVYWYYILACILAASVIYFVNISEDAKEIYINTVTILFVWPSLAIQVKRWHDIDSSGVWIFINLAPIIGGVWALIANGFIRGTRGDNFYGSDPYASEAKNQT